MSDKDVRETVVIGSDGLVISNVRWKAVDEPRSDAALIAAASGLYEALEKFVDLHLWSESERVFYVAPEGMEIARAALSKARGEA